MITAEDRNLEELFACNFLPKATPYELAHIIIDASTSGKFKFCKVIFCSYLTDESTQNDVGPLGKTDCGCYNRKQAHKICGSTYKWFRKSSEWCIINDTYIETLCCTQLIMTIQNHIEKIRSTSNMSKVNFLKYMNGAINTMQAVKSTVNGTHRNMKNIPCFINACAKLMLNQNLFDECGVPGNLICFDNGLFNLNKNVFDKLIKVKLNENLCVYRNRIKYGTDVCKYNYNDENRYITSAVTIRSNLCTHKTCVIDNGHCLDRIPQQDLYLFISNNYSKIINRLVLYERFILMNELFRHIGVHELIKYIQQIFIAKFLDNFIST